MVSTAVIVAATERQEILPPDKRVQRPTRAVSQKSDGTDMYSDEVARLTWQERIIRLEERLDSNRQTMEAFQMESRDDRASIRHQMKEDMQEVKNKMDEVGKDVRAIATTTAAGSVWTDIVKLITTLIIGGAVGFLFHARGMVP